MEPQEKYIFLPTGTFDGVKEIYDSLGIKIEENSSLEEGQQIFALGIRRQDGEACGIASGIYCASQQRFQILGLYVRREDRTKDLVREALQELLRLAREHFQPARYEWTYQQKEENRDSHLALVQGLAMPWLSPAVRQRAGVVMKMDTALLRNTGMKMRHNRDYWQPEHMASLGYSFLPWRTCGEEVKEKIRILLASPEENTEGLSPFIGEYDPAASFVLMHESSVCGWVICGKVSPDSVEIRRWYVAEAARRNMAGQFLGAYMLRAIQEQYKTVYFTVLNQSKSMLRFAKGYLGRAVVEETPLYCLEMEERI